MNKVYLGVGVVVLVAVAGVYFVLCQPTAEPVSIKPVDTATSSVATTTNTTELDPSDIELDLSKLQGKDRLYTEEEGKYENLSEEERRMVDSMICGDDYQDTWLCDELTISPITKDIRLVSLRNGVAGITIPSDVSKGMFFLYDFQNQKIIERYRDIGDIVYGPSYIIHNIADDGWGLELYRPGMTDFIKIPVSEEDIGLGVSYLDNRNGFNLTLPMDFSGNTITAYLHTFKNCVDVGGETFPGLLDCEIETKTPVTFDLSNLP